MLNGQRTQSIRGLLHSGERGGKVCRLWYVVKAHDCEVVRDAQAQLRCRLKRPQRHLIIARKDRLKVRHLLNQAAETCLTTGC